MIKTIYADLPWYEIGGGKIKRGADRHYSLMKTNDICNLQIINMKIGKIGVMKYDGT